MKVFFVGAGPGAADLLTVRALRLIESARICIFAGSLVGEEITALIPEDSRKYDSAGMNLGEIVAVVREAKDNNIDVVRLHSGESAIYGAIGEQMSELDRLGIEYEVIPGISSFQSAAAGIKAELTAPEISQTVILTRIEGRTPVPDGQELAKLAAAKATMCIYLSINRIDEIAAVLSTHYGSDCPIAVVFHSSRHDELIIRGTLADIPAKVAVAGIRKTAIILVGRALGRDLPVSKLYDAAFAHGCREGKVA